jgi:hypothetical protein
MPTHCRSGCCRQTLRAARGPAAGAAPRPPAWPARCARPGPSRCAPSPATPRRPGRCAASRSAPRAHPAGPARRCRPAGCAAAAGPSPAAEAGPAASALTMRRRRFTRSSGTRPGARRSTCGPWSHGRCPLAVSVRARPGVAQPRPSSGRAGLATDCQRSSRAALRWRQLSSGISPRSSSAWPASSLISSSAPGCWWRSPSSV